MIEITLNDNSFGHQMVYSDNYGYQHFYRNHYINRLNISPVWCPLYSSNQKYVGTTTNLNSDWTTNHLARAIFQNNLGICFGPSKQIQQTDLGNSTTPNTMRYQYTPPYLLSDLNNFCTKIQPNNTRYRLGDDTGNNIVCSLGVSNILIFNKKLSLEEIENLSTYTQTDIINMFPANN